MRYFWTSEKQCIMRICDAEFIYAFEFIGNPGRLVITPLTDRCYITLTQVCCAHWVGWLGQRDKSFIANHWKNSSIFYEHYRAEYLR
jgi:hypothetical protein